MHMAIILNNSNRWTFFPPNCLQFFSSISCNGFHHHHLRLRAKMCWVWINEIVVVHFFRGRKTTMSVAHANKANIHFIRIQAQLVCVNALINRNVFSIKNIWKRLNCDERLIVMNRFTVSLTDWVAVTIIWSDKCLFLVILNAYHFRMWLLCVERKRTSLPRAIANLCNLSPAMHRTHITTIRFSARVACT